ncbi:hypothetical protein B0H17DRAFT_477988 [Mycena rosella]|uniref:DUF7779 domain-containing protein n=1 Tax=Mycena rosella TaxID=1033263 RepID=A0AAD7C847_MYCRO|nr:hypothetical protein B0H17DRAFT_477988 [Mycena rosella]
MASPSAAASSSSATSATPNASSSSSLDWLEISLLTARTITAAAECAPFPYIKGAFGTAVILLETVEKVKKNREDWKDLCEITVNIITTVRNQIREQGDSGASRFKKLCEDLGKFLSEVHDRVQLLQKEPKGFRGRIKEVVKLRSTADEISKYGNRIRELRSNFVLAATIEMNFHLAKVLPIAPLNNVVAAPNINNCPPGSKIFHGRETILARMYKYYAEDRWKQRIFLLHGLGGAGKTQIALKFIEDSSQFSDVFFIDASTPETIATGLMNIAVSKNSGSNAQDALRWISRTAEEWLLIFDNADDPKINLHNYFPRCKHGNILITSRNPGLAVHAGANAAVSDMEETDSVELLLKSAAQDSTPQNREVAREIVKELCYFPLAIIQAGAFISKSGALNSYLAYYSANRVRLLSEKPAQTHDDYASTVYTTWQISFEQLTPPAATLLQLCSFLHHQGISEQIFSNASLYTFPADGPSKEELRGPLEFLSHFTDSIGSWDSLRFMDLIHELIGYSLISFDPVTKVFSIHPLVHKWSQSTVTDQRGYHSHMVAIAGMSFEATPNETKRVASLQWVAHADSLLHEDTAAAIAAIAFGLECTNMYTWAGQDKKAEPLALAALQRRRDTLGEDHIGTLTAMIYVANIHCVLGRLKQAEALESVVFEKRKIIFGENHPDTLRAMGNLAETFHSLGRLQEAEELQSVVLKTQKTNLGEDHPETLRAMGNLANTYLQLGRLQEAEALQSLVFEKGQSIFGEDHPDTLIAMAHLAVTYCGLGRLQEAEALQSVVFEKRKTVFGEDHPDTLSAMGNLAVTYQRLGQLQEAEALQSVVFEKQTTILGEDHPETLIAMGNLSITYHQLGRLQPAEALQSILFEKQKTILGEDHPETVTAMGHLAHTYHYLGRLQEAEALQCVVLEKRKTILGEDHPHTLIAMSNLADTYYQLGRLQETEALESVVLDKRKTILGEDHPDTLSAMNNLAVTYQTLDRLQEAEALQSVVFEKRKTILGEDHPDTLIAMNNLADIYHKLGRIEEAEALRQRQS